MPKLPTIERPFIRNRGLPNVRFWILNSGISWCRLNNEKILYASVKKISRPHVFLIQILIIWQKKKKNRRRRKRRKRFLYFLFLLFEHCWHVNRGQKIVAIVIISDLKRLRGKWSHLFCVSLAVRGSQSTFCAANFQITLLSLDTHPPAKTSRFLSQRLTRKR